MEIQPSSSPALAMQAKSLELARDVVETAQAAQGGGGPADIVELSRAAELLSKTHAA